MAKLSDAEVESLLFAERASAPTTPATGKWRPFFKSDGMYIVDDAGAVTGPFAASAGSGATVVSTSYAAGSDGSLPVGGTTSTSLVDVDATNVKIVCDADASGEVLVEASVLAGQATINKYTFLGLREGAADVTGSKQRVFYATVASTFIRVHYACKITGLTPSSTHTYKLAIATTTGGTAYVQNGPDNGPVVMKATS